MASDRVHWGSRLGFVLAAAGSAVGLGNLWKFPYLTWENNGGAFVIVYLFSVAGLGLPIMMAEILVGRRAQLSPVPAFRKLGGKRWQPVGWLGVLTGAVIQSYYMVIAGWSLRSFWQCLRWSVQGYQPATNADFNAFLTNGPAQIALAALFAFATCAIVYRGIGGGIEKANKFLMPALALILVYLVATTMTMPGRDQALTMMFQPRFSKLPAMAILEAVGQAFFSLSLGLGAMITYGSYLRKEDSIFRASLAVCIFDACVALLACAAMFTIIFSVPGLKESVSGSTVGMVFITLPVLFYTAMPGGVVLGPLFYVLVAFAALTSTISLGEVVAAYLIDERGWSRPKATVISGAVLFAMTILAALSFGAVGPLSGFEIFDNKRGVFSTLDHLASNWMLPLGGLATTIFVGWFLGKRASLEELGLQRETMAYKVWLWLIRIVAPAAIAALLIAVALGTDFS